MDDFEETLMESETRVGAAQWGVMVKEANNLIDAAKRGIITAGEVLTEQIQMVLNVICSAWNLAEEEPDVPDTLDSEVSRRVLHQKEKHAHARQIAREYRTLIRWCEQNRPYKPVPYNRRG